MSSLNYRWLTNKDSHCHLTVTRNVNGHRTHRTHFPSANGKNWIPFLSILLLVFGRVNFNCVPGIYFYCSKQAMFTISIVFFILISNTYGMRDGVLELSPDPLQSIPLLFWNSWIRHKYVCSFGVFLSHSRILNSFGDVTITVVGLHITFDLYSALMVF